ncbi:xylitol dehydrogenase [Cantharellus anzutake]|uniref:xylitol dehydrogenase n=1 Tax=Cantharellus anzutake TaxID=1750568 RepID=UPI0019085E35|nr:xylitol dehydrogenase [Cantharellus anzutake]KAF8339025.1 xylitol dehydrogenase [Cantharellus anzutake]
MANESNRSFVLKGVESTAFEERKIPEIGAHDVLVEVKKTGICGSDIHYLAHGRIGDFVVKEPMVLGHESAGIVVATGSLVKDLKVGAKVALEPGRSCTRCESCKSGRYQLCPDMIFAATPPYDGTLARYYSLPADLAYELPANMSLEEGALMEPLSVGIHSVSTLGQFHSNQSIAVFGAGPVGLLCMAVARALGAKRVIGIDIVKERLAFATSYAATDVFLPPKPEEGENKIDYSRRVTDLLAKGLDIEQRGPKAIDLVIDASGAEACIRMGIYLVKYGGTHIQVGMGSPEIVLPITTLIAKELRVLGSFRYGPGDYNLAISLVAQGKIDVKSLITHEYPFEKADEAFATTRAGKGADGKGVIKAVINGPK